ncbi:hypothetical protein [Kitasatospora fiedleri]|uniref:hypothetical protein n=1 Tax=Kitasatospora fiedleri TaxID=2991545 RepID=UPI00249B3B5E|nr:hypothetical protein [Kitasatospora fiedleri]
MTDTTNSTEAMRAEASRAYAIRLAIIEIRTAAKLLGAHVPDSYLQYLDYSKICNADGTVRADAVAEIIEPFAPPKEPVFAQDLGLGRQGGFTHYQMKPYDVRNR